MLEIGRVLTVVFDMPAALSTPLVGRQRQLVQSGFEIRIPSLAVVYVVFRHLVLQGNKPVFF